ncbi:MAG: cupredoxin domain-containing protein [Actinobacteria bacterium]|nr:cupredoxin domain-containing protein [Actinomycetota bacterium]
MAGTPRRLKDDSPPGPPHARAVPGLGGLPLARRNFARTLLSASLLLGSVVAGVLAAPSPVGAADSKIIQISVSDAGFSPSVIKDVNVGDRLLFSLDKTTDQHTITWESNSVCPGTRGAEPCWPELRFDDNAPNCLIGNVRLPDRRCMIVEEPGVIVRYHDAFHPTNGGEVSVLGETTTTTGPTTTTTTRGPTTTSTTRLVTTTTMQTTTTTAAAAIHPFVVADPGPTPTTTTSKPATNNVPVAPPADKDKGKSDDKGKAKAKAAGAETSTTATTAPVALPSDVVFDEASLTPGMTLAPAAAPDDSDEAAIDAAPVVSLLDHVEKPDDGANLMLLALGALTCLLLAGGIWGWHNRSSRYDPA